MVSGSDIVCPSQRELSLSRRGQRCQDYCGAVRFQESHMEDGFAGSEEPHQAALSGGPRP